MKQTDKAKRLSYGKIFSLLLQSVRQYKRDARIALLVYLFQACSECVVPLLLGFMIDEMNRFQASGGDPNAIVSKVVVYSCLLVLFSCFAFGMALLGARFSSKAAAGFAANLRQDIFYKTQGFSFENIDRFTKASLVTRQTTDVTNVMNAYMMVLRNAMLAPVYFVFSIVGSIAIGASVSWVYATTVPIVAFGMFAIIALALTFFSKAFVRYDALNKAVEENVRGIRTVKTYAREDYEKSKFEKASEAIRKILTKGEIAAGMANPLMNVSINISMALVVSFGTLAILRGEINVGSFSILTNYGIFVLYALLMLAMIMVMIAMSMASARRIHEVLAEETTVEEPQNALTTVADGSVEFQNVSFAYKDGDGRKGKPVLHGIDLSIRSGESVGIIGGTGSSKSTLVNLIPRFYDPDSGRVLVGGRDIREYDKKALRDQVSMVLQKNILFSGSLADNIRWGKEDASLEEVEEVCRIAQADDFVQQLPGKYDYQVEQGGTNFSGGQKQRLCIARALIKEPKVLIFDDSTSAVDTKTDRKIQEGLAKSRPGVTKIVIAQRISSVLNADRIVVMDEGRIESVGSARELYEKSPIFKEVCDLQGIQEESL